MKLEIITTGDEVINGVIVDTNTSWIAGRLSGLGVDIVRHTSVADDLDDIGVALREAATRADVVVVTGGLGPTADDLTIEAAAKVFEVSLQRDEGVINKIKSYFEQASRPFSSSNEKQAMIPKGAKVLANKVGTAPGVEFKFNNTVFFFLPGVPKELYQMFDECVLLWIKENCKNFVAEKIMTVFGISEASIDEKLQGVDIVGVRLSFRVKFPYVLLKIVASGLNKLELESCVDRVKEEIKSKLGDYILGEGDVTLGEVVGKLLSEKGMTLAVAESCTGGMLSNEITNVAGASKYFERGIVTYSNTSKSKLLGVSGTTIDRHGAVSEETAREMAVGVRENANVDIGIGITGIAGPSGGTPAKPVGTVFIGLATPKSITVDKFCFQRDRIWFKSLAAATALDMVRKYLMAYTKK